MAESAPKTHFIAGAIKHPGAFTAQAKKAGMSVAAYAQKEKHAKGKTGQRARLAIILRKESKKRKHTIVGGG
jgi:hypothetical protein